MKESRRMGGRKEGSWRKVGGWTEGRKMKESRRMGGRKEGGGKEEEGGKEGR